MQPKPPSCSLNPRHAALTLNPRHAEGVNIYLYPGSSFADTTDTLRLQLLSAAPGNPVFTDTVFNSNLTFRCAVCVRVWGGVGGGVDTVFNSNLMFRCAVCVRVCGGVGVGVGGGGG